MISPTFLSSGLEQSVHIVQLGHPDPTPIQRRKGDMTRAGVSDGNKFQRFRSSLILFSARSQDLVSLNADSIQLT
jgi:hypothetical protein